jgi:hypothetical protein
MLGMVANDVRAKQSKSEDNCTLVLESTVFEARICIVLFLLSELQTQTAFVSAQTQLELENKGET